MRGAWPVADVRAAEAALLAVVGPGVLMQRAAAGLAGHCIRVLDRVYGTPVVVLAGAGNNGGDALYAGARLARRGAAVTAVLVDPDRAHPAGLAALRAAGGAAGPATEGSDISPAALAAVRGAALVLDGIVGIGGAGALRPAAAALADAVAGAVVVAVDVPSGVAADTGAAPGASVRADVTVSFGCLKVGLLVGAGVERAGRVELVDIGLAPHLPPPAVQVLDGADVAELVPVPGPGSDKYTRGVVGVAAGSAEYTGAAVLSTGGAVRGGAGMVRYVGTAAEHVRIRWPEAVVTDRSPSRAGRVQSWVAGPGLGTDSSSLSVLREVLGADVPAVVDADGLTMLGQHPELVRRRSAPTVLTPHDREFERLAGPVGDDRVAAARRAAVELGAVVLLKGYATIVADPTGTVYVNPTGTPWLATAGCGDVLSGLIGALLAGGVAPARAAAAGAYLHGLAGQIAAGGVGPSAVGVLDAVPAALRAVAAERRTVGSRRPPPRRSAPHRPA